MARPRIAILHYSCPPVIGGVEFVIEAHARLLADHGFNVRLVVGKGGRAHPKVRTVVIPEISSDGGPVSRVIRSLREGAVPPSFSRAVKRVEKKLSAALRDVDVCMMHNVLTMHFNLVLTAALANIMRRRRKIHFVGWTHDLTFSEPNYKEHQRSAYPWTLLSQKLPGCNYCAISEQRKGEMLKVFGIRASEVAVIPDGIHVPELLGLTTPVMEVFRMERLDRTDVVALTPTRIVRRKNLEVGIEIVAALKRGGKSVRWLITGAPDPHNADAVEYFKKLLKLRKRLRVEREVIFLCERVKRRLSNEDVRALFAVSDMLIFPSAREGFGIPVLEAELRGLLLVVSDIPAFREIAGDSAVYIHRGHKPETVARNAIAALGKSPRLVSRKEVISGYSWDAVFADSILPAVLHPRSVWRHSRLR